MVGGGCCEVGWWQGCEVGFQELDAGVEHLYCVRAGGEGCDYCLCTLAMLSSSGEW